jgi:hypothetical protein
MTFQIPVVRHNSRSTSSERLELLFEAVADGTVVGRYVS